MKSLWYRLKYSIQADLHQAFDSKEYNNPIAMLNQYIREAEKQTTSMGQLLERQRILKMELQHEFTEADQMAQKRRKQLELAVEVDQEDLINFAQAEVSAYEKRASDLTDSIKETAVELISLEIKFEEMKHKLKDMKVRQLQLMGKENMTRARFHMDQVITPKESENQLATFGEMNQYIETLSGKAESTNETSSSMERRLESLQTTSVN